MVADSHAAQTARAEARAARERNPRARVGRAVLDAMQRDDDGLRAPEVARILGIDRTTVYRTPELRRLAFKPTGRSRGMRWDRREIEAHKLRTRVSGDATTRAA